MRGEEGRGVRPHYLISTITMKWLGLTDEIVLVGFRGWGCDFLFFPCFMQDRDRGRRRDACSGRVGPGMGVGGPDGWAEVGRRAA